MSDEKLSESGYRQLYPCIEVKGSECIADLFVSRLSALLRVYDATLCFCDGALQAELEGGVGVRVFLPVRSGDLPHFGEISDITP